MSAQVYRALRVATAPRRLTFSGPEWRRLTGLYAVIGGLHLLGWGLYLHYAALFPSLVGLGFVAYMFGLRHAFDADHIAAVDDSVRFMLQKGKKPLGVGFFFSLGHSTIVLGLALCIAYAASAVKHELPSLQHIGAVLGAGVSGTFLWIIGILNLLVLLDILKVWQLAKSGAHSHVHLEELLAKRGLLNRLFAGRLRKLMNHSWQMYPLGLLFGLGFDTASELGLLAMTAGASAGNLPIPAVLSLPILFAAGMTMMDTTDGVLMCKAYNWASLNPLRKIFYNITTTGLSVTVALVIGTIELLQVGIHLGSLHGRFFDFIAHLDFGSLGYLIVGLFLCAWALSVAAWKLRTRVASRLAIAGALLLLFAANPLVSRADTVASLLGNFTINQYCGLQLADDAVSVHYVVVFGQLPALRELHLADTNGDGVTSQAERDAYVQRLSPQFARALNVSVDGVAVPLHLTHWSSSLPTEQGGFSLRLDADFQGTVLQTGAGKVRSLRFTNSNYSGRVGWREISVQASADLQIFDADAYSDSLTHGLRDALQALPQGGPLNESAVDFSFTHGAPPAGSRALASRPGTSTSAAAPLSRSAPSREAAWLQNETQSLVKLISTPTVEPHVALLALLAALVLGALHALSPGHGKTIVGAYLIGSKGTAKHALFLGFTVTVTHTLGVFALGFATLFASQFIVPERLFPILSLLSGLLVFGMGLVLFAQRWRGATWSSLPRFTVAYEPARPVYALRNYADDHDSQPHSHGGTIHSHLPPGADGSAVTWRSLLALGISGGLIPCPSAMVLLLAAVALNKTAYGLALVVTFSLGLALTLTGIGLAFLYASRLKIPSSAARWARVLPVLSAGVITAVGAVLCVGALSVPAWTSP